MMALLFTLVLAPSASAGERLAAGMSHTCAIDTAGAISCWGDNSKSQLNGIPVDGPFTSVTAGENHTCAIRTTGTLACWGDNVYKQTTDVPTGTFTFVDSAYRHTCALGTAGKVACWGDNSFSQISGVPTADFKALSVGMGGSCALKRDDDTAVCFGGLYWNPNFPLPSGSFDVVDAGGFSACGIRSRHRTLSCWGNNQMDEQKDVPTGEFTALDSHVTHSCGIRVDRSLACWGNNSGGQRNGMPTEGSFVDVSVGYVHSCAMKVDGTVKCWGGNYLGQDLTLVPADLAFSDIAAGGTSSCGVKADRALFCWGAGAGADGSVPAPPAGSFGDITAPAVEPVVTGRQGMNGWYIDDVEVSWNVTDAETPILSRPGCDPTIIAADTAATELTCVATAAEATTSSLTIRRDTVVPTLTCDDSLGADGTITVSVADATSGPVAATLTAPSETTPTGVRRATLVGRDIAGHSAAITCSYRETTLTTATPVAPTAPVAAKCVTRGAVAAALRTALGRGITIRRATMRLGNGAVTKLKTNRRRTAVTLPRALKAGAVRIVVTYRKKGATKTLRRTFTAC